MNAHEQTRESIALQDRARRWVRVRFERARVQLIVFSMMLRNALTRERAVGRSGAVVSLTTYGRRFATVYLTIESIARGRNKPSRLILWLDDVNQYSNLPSTLKRLCARGVEVALCENFGPHKKYFPFVEASETFTSALVTADDDVLYPHDWLAGLERAHEEAPDRVCCYMARRVEVDGAVLSPYDTWQYVRGGVPSYRNIAIGVGGILYPPDFLAKLKAAGRGFADCCPRADDLWLHVTALRSGVKVKQIQEAALRWDSLPETQEGALYHANLGQGGNDRQIALTYGKSDIAIIEGDV